MKIDENELQSAAKLIAKKEIEKNKISKKYTEKIENAAIKGLSEAMRLLTMKDGNKKFEEEWLWFVRQSILNKMFQIKIFDEFEYFTNFSLSYHGHYSIEFKVYDIFYSLPVYITFNLIHKLLEQEGINHNTLNLEDWWDIKFQKAKIRLFLESNIDKLIKIDKKNRAEYESYYDCNFYVINSENIVDYRLFYIIKVKS